MVIFHNVGGIWAINRHMTVVCIFFPENITSLRVRRVLWLSEEEIYFINMANIISVNTRSQHLFNLKYTYLVHQVLRTRHNTGSTNGLKCKISPNCKFVAIHISESLVCAGDFHIGTLQWF